MSYTTRIPMSRRRLRMIEVSLLAVAGLCALATLLLKLHGGG